MSPGNYSWGKELDSSPFPYSYVIYGVEASVANT